MGANFCQQNIGAVLLESQNQHLFASLVHHRILGRSMSQTGLGCVKTPKLKFQIANGARRVR
jgi:hypothetical protein